MQDRFRHSVLYCRRLQPILHPCISVWRPLFWILGGNMKKDNLFRMIFVSCAIVLSIMVLISCGQGFVEYYDKPVGETPLWFWFWFM
jgi:hypothetical protein